MKELVHIRQAESAALSVEEKENLLLARLAAIPSLIVALSGGADSAPGTAPPPLPSRRACLMAGKGRRNVPDLWSAGKLNCAPSDSANAASDSTTNSHAWK